MERPKPTTTKFEVEIKGEGAAQRFRNLLDALEKLSNWGASRELTIEWDGDGADKLTVLSADIDSTLDRKEFDDVLNHSLIRVMSTKAVRAPYKRSTN